MGNGTSHEVRDALDGGTQLITMVTEVHGLSANSTSFSDTWVLHLKEGIEHDRSPIDKVFVKLWMKTTSAYSIRDKIDRRWTQTWRSCVVSDEFQRTPGLHSHGPDTTIDYGETEDDHRVKSSMASIGSVMKSIRRLDYERDLLRRHILPLTTYRICPNFIRFIGNVTYTGADLRRLLHVSGITADALVRNTLFMVGANKPFIGKQATKRPSIGDPSSAVVHGMEKICLKSTYAMMVSEAVTGENDSSLYTYMRSITPTTCVGDLWRVLFQVVAACYALGLSRVTHHDLHLNNVLVSLVPSPRRVSYRYGPRVYCFTRTHHVRVFDFDHAFSESMGVNSGSGTNYYHRHIDLYRVMRSVHSLLGKCDPSLATTLSSILSPEPETLSTCFSGQKHPFAPKAGQRPHMYTLCRILHRIAVQAGEDEILIDGDEVGVDKFHVYSCRPDMFRVDGTVRNDDM